jgi:hypothetical protein
VTDRETPERKRAEHAAEWPPINLQNATARPLQVCLEPWASVYSVPPRATYQLQLFGEAHPRGLTIEVSEEGVTVYPETSGFRLRNGTIVVDERP